MRIFLITIVAFGCASHPESVGHTQFENNESIDSLENSLNKSTESLDRTLEMMDKMIVDLDKMNRNMDSIFKAVSGCETDDECKSLKEEYAQEYEENKLNEEN